MDQAVHTTSGGYEDASCIAKAGEIITGDYCQYGGPYDGCLKFYTCCDYPVIAYPKSQLSNGPGVNLTMRGRACSTSNPCAAYYEWLKKDPSTIQNNVDSQNSSLTFPCKYNTGKVGTSFEALNYCAVRSIGPLLAGEGWCSVVSSSAEYPVLRDTDDKNQRLKPLWITFLVLGPLVTAACCIANRARKQAPATSHPESPPGSGPAPAHQHFPTFEPVHAPFPPVTLPPAPTPPRPSPPPVEWPAHPAAPPAAAAAAAAGWPGTSANPSAAHWSGSA